MLLLQLLLLLPESLALLVLTLPPSPAAAVPRHSTLQLLLPERLTVLDPPPPYMPAVATLGHSTLLLQLLPAELQESVHRKLALSSVGIALAGLLLLLPAARLALSASPAAQLLLPPASPALHHQGMPMRRGCNMLTSCARATLGRLLVPCMAAAVLLLVPAVA
jgi:hypothetical protein